MKCQLLRNKKIKKIKKKLDNSDYSTIQGELPVSSFPRVDPIYLPSSIYQTYAMDLTTSNDLTTTCKLKLTGLTV